MSKPINASTIARYSVMAGFFHLAQMATVLALAWQIFALTLIS